MKKNIRNILVILLAVCICAAIGFKASDARLKADEAGPETAAVEEAVDQVVETPVDTEAPAEEEAEVSQVEIEVPAELKEPEETQPDDETSEVADPEEETLAEETKEEAAEEETEAAGKSISTWFDYEGKPYIGMTVVIKSSIKGYSDDVAYKWQYSTDGKTWTDAPDGNSSTYTFVLDETTCQYKWRLGVYDYDPIAETEAPAESGTEAPAATEADAA